MAKSHLAAEGSFSVAVIVSNELSWMRFPNFIQSLRFGVLTLLCFPRHHHIPVMIHSEKSGQWAPRLCWSQGSKLTCSHRKSLRANSSWPSERTVSWGCFLKQRDDWLPNTAEASQKLRHSSFSRSTPITESNHWVSIAMTSEYGQGHWIPGLTFVFCLIKEIQELLYWSFNIGCCWAEIIPSQHDSNGLDDFEFIKSVFFKFRTCVVVVFLSN